MRACRLTIATTVDGKETHTVRKGEFLFKADKTELCYREEKATVSLFLEKDMLTICRQGDYDMRLRLKEKKTFSGMLGLGGASGELAVRTHKLLSKADENGWLLLAHYTLLIGNEPQEMKIRLCVQVDK